MACGSLYALEIGTISRPRGASDKGIVFQHATPNGNPTMVIIKSSPATRCSSASSQPKKMIHTTLPITDQTPASRRQVVVRPNGQRTKLGFWLALGYAVVGCSRSCSS
jgi:hypothetical protein